MANDYSNKYVDGNGLSHFWSLIKQKFVAKETGKGLSTNDFTKAYKDKLDGIDAGANKYTLPTASSSTKGGVKIGSGLSMSGEVLSAPVMTGASASAAGAAGLVPAPAKGDTSKLLMSNGAWGSMAFEWEGASEELLDDDNSDPNARVFMSNIWAQITLDAINLEVLGTDPFPTASLKQTGLLGRNDIEHLRGICYAECSTAAATETKSISVPGYFQKTGAMIAVKFTQTNTAAVANLKLKVTSTAFPNEGAAGDFHGVYDAAPIKYRNGNLPSAGTLAANRIYMFIYDGSAYQLLGDLDTNTTYSAATQSANGLMSSGDKKKLDAFGAASTYALKSDISSMYKHKGTKATKADLPTSGNTAGDVWNVTAEKGMNYVWTGSEWDAIGEVFTIDAITNTEIDTIVAS